MADDKDKDTNKTGIRPSSLSLLSSMRTSTGTASSAGASPAPSDADVIGSLRRVFQALQVGARPQAVAAPMLSSQDQAIMAALSDLADTPDEAVTTATSGAGATAFPQQQQQQQHHHQPFVPVTGPLSVPHIFFGHDGRSIPSQEGRPRQLCILASDLATYLRLGGAMAWANYEMARSPNADYGDERRAIIFALAAVIDHAFRLSLHTLDGNCDAAVGLFLAASSTLNGLISAGRAANRRSAEAIVQAFSVTDVMPAGQAARLASADALIRLQQRVGIAQGRRGGHNNGNNNNGAPAARGAGGARQQ